MKRWLLYPLWAVVILAVFSALALYDSVYHPFGGGEKFERPGWLGPGSAFGPT